GFRGEQLDRRDERRRGCRRNAGHHHLQQQLQLRQSGHRQWLRQHRAPEVSRARPNPTIEASTTMTKIRISLMAFAMLACLGAAPAQANLARTFVSPVNGNDANDCNRLTPCRTFQRAHDNTFDQGEITVLDPGGYGAVTITKSVSIINDG